MQSHRWRTLRVLFHSHPHHFASFLLIRQYATASFTLLFDGRKMFDINNAFNAASKYLSLFLYTIQLARLNGINSTLATDVQHSPSNNDAQNTYTALNRFASRFHVRNAMTVGSIDLSVNRLDNSFEKVIILNTVTGWERQREKIVLSLAIETRDRMPAVINTLLTVLLNAVSTSFSVAHRILEHYC